MLTILDNSFGNTGSANKNGSTKTNPKRNTNHKKEKKKASNTRDFILPQKNKWMGDELIEGKWITLNGEPFRIFVAKRPNKFYHCQLCYKYEENESKRNGFDINTIPDAIKIIQKYNDKEWHNGKWKTFKYVKFEGDNAKSEAKAFYKDILSFIEQNTKQ